MPALWPGGETFPSFVGEDSPPPWHLSRTKWNAFCCKHLICSFWTVWVTRSKASVKCLKQCLSAVDFFIPLVLKPLKGGERLLLYFHKSTGKAHWQPLATEWVHAPEHWPFVSWLQQTWGGTGAGFELHLFPPEPPALTVPPPRPRPLSTEPWESELLSTVGFCLLLRWKRGFLVCSVLTCLGEKMDF